MYTITLADGTKLENLDMNGSNFASKEKINESIFTDDNLAIVKISNGETETTYTDLVFIQQMKWVDGTFCLAFRKKTDKEKILATVTANASSVTDLQVALTEVYEMILGDN